MDTTDIANTMDPIWILRPSKRRKLGACENCRQRKLRCDAINSALPNAACSNCAAYSLKCSVPASRRRGTDGGESSVQKETVPRKQDLGISTLHPMQVLETHLSRDADELNLYAQFLRQDLRNAPILEPGRVAYLGESSNFRLLVDPRSYAEWVVHYQLPETFMNSRAKLFKMDSLELDLLRQKGAFSLLAGRLCDDLVDSFFRSVGPELPIIHRGYFMAQYRDPNNPPSLLLLQAVFLAASTVTKMESQTTGKQLYQRVKALYDSGYEDNRVILVQALILVAWYSEKSGAGVEQVLYWNGLATTVALGAGMHRSAANSPLSVADKRLWRRIYWTLFVRDRAMALHGRVAQIHTDDSDVEMICEDDFADDEYPPDPVQGSFFIHWVKLYLLVDNLAALPTVHTGSLANAIENEGLLAEWLESRPKQLTWEETGYNNLSISLHRSYQIVASLLGR